MIYDQLTATTLRQCIATGRNTLLHQLTLHVWWATPLYCPIRWSLSLRCMSLSLCGLLHIYQKVALLKVLILSSTTPDQRSSSSLRYSNLAVAFVRPTTRLCNSVQHSTTTCSMNGRNHLRGRSKPTLEHAFGPYQLALSWRRYSRCRHLQYGRFVLACSWSS